MDNEASDSIAEEPTETRAQGPTGAQEAASSPDAAEADQGSGKAGK